MNPLSRFAAAPLLGAVMLVALLLAPAATCAQAPQSYRIAGRVVNATTGDPVRRATVSVLSQEQNSLVASVLTDMDGNFAVPGLAAGKYPLTASRRGFRTAYYDEHGGFNTAIVTGPGQDTGHLVFQLAPGAVIYGTVTGDGGDPEQNSSVVLFRRDPAAPNRPPVQVEGGSTDDTGAYEFSDLEAGDYFVAVGAQPWYAMHSMPAVAQPGENSLDVAYPVTFFDSTTDEASASLISVTAGARAEANISLHAVPAIRLKVAGPRQPDTSPGIDLRQTVFGAEFPAQVDVQSSSNGSWDIVGLAPGHYELNTTNPPRAMEVDASSNMDIDAASGTPSPAVQGAVRMADGSPPGDVNLILGRRDNTGSQLNATAHRGKFQFEAVPPGVWMLSAASTQGSIPVSSITGGGGGPGNQITVRDQPLSITVTLSRSQTRVEGFARSGGKAAPGAMIVLVPRDPAAYVSLVRLDQSDSDGSFSLRDVPPGRYTVVAIADGWKLDRQDPNVIARFLPGGEPVTIGTQAGAVVQLPRPVDAASP
jgi:5-hydroxyisourate hydrolase-like protein (transthyretin family)